VNAPESGTIKELLVNEEDTVVVGQELVKLEPGEGGAPAEKPKAAPEKTEETKTEAAPPKPETKEPAPSKPEPAKEQLKPKPAAKKTEPEPAAPAKAGSRDERRVC
jgi:2-oxoglutarate dehydrogenase E2 component (dihydrolipoamide succinyltransferase)